jgi:hypothetical protein
VITASPRIRSAGIRHAAWLAGAWVLIGLAAAMGSSVLTGQGLLIAALAVPVALAGFYVIRSRSLARVVGLAVAGLYAIGVAFVATAPSRGLAMAPGQPAAPLDALTVAVALCFAVAAVFLLVGEPEPRVS